MHKSIRTAIALATISAVTLAPAAYAFARCGPAPSAPAGPAPSASAPSAPAGPSGSPGYHPASNYSGEAYLSDILAWLTGVTYEAPPLFINPAAPETSNIPIPVMKPRPGPELLWQAMIDSERLARMQNKIPGVQSEADFNCALRKGSTC